MVICLEQGANDLHMVQLSSKDIQLTHYNFLIITSPSKP